jgi:hypothetical protein
MALYETARSQKESLLEYVAADVARSLEGVRALIIETSGFVAASRTDYPAIVDRLRSLERNRNVLIAYYAGMTPHANGGVFLSSSGWAPPDGFDQTALPWFFSALADDGFYYSAPYRDGRSEDLYVTVSHRVKASGRETIGVIGIDLRLSSTLSGIEWHEPEDEAYLVHRDTPAIIPIISHRPAATLRDLAERGVPIAIAIKDAPFAAATYVSTSAVPLEAGRLFAILLVPCIGLAALSYAATRASGKPSRTTAIEGSAYGGDAPFEPPENPSTKQDHAIPFEEL